MLYTKNSSASPKVIEAQLENPLRMRALLNFTSYLVTQMNPSNLVVDKRWATQYDVLRLRRQKAQVTSRASQIEQLQQLLEAAGFEATLPTLESTETQLSESVELTTNITRGAVASFEFEAQYPIRKEPYLVTIGDETYEVTVMPVTQKLNLNFIQLKPLERYFEYLGIKEDEAERLAATIIDWRDKDDLVSAFGAESSFYQTQRHSWAARNNLFRRWDEVAYLQGMTPQMIRFLRRHFTIYGRESRVHYHFLTAEGLAALTDLGVDITRRALDFYSRPRNESNQDDRLEDYISDLDAKKIGAFVTEEEMSPVLAITIKNKSTVLSAVYDKDARDLQDIYWQ